MSLLKFLKPVRWVAMGCAACALSIPASGWIEDAPYLKVQGVVIVWAADPASNAPVIADFVIDSGTGTNAAASGDVDLISADTHTVVTGTLSATQDSFSGATGGMPFLLTNTDRGTFSTDTNGDSRISDQDAFTPFGLNGSSDTQVDATKQYSSFYVASNVPFAIDAQAFTPSTYTEYLLLLITRLQLSATQSGNDGLSFGASSQLPHSGGSTGGFTNSVRLWDLRTARNVFTGDQRTAIAPGTIADQSVRFDAEYSIAATNLRGYDLSLGTFDFEVEVVYSVYVP
ncbi:MAG: hypothetical protein Hens3KO_10520 [Henriciella sp.]